MERARVRQAEAEAREREAEAAIVEAEAATAQAHAIEAMHRARKEPARQNQRQTAGWVWILLTLLAGTVTVCMPVVGFFVDPLAFLPAFPAGLALVPLRPWELLSGTDDRGGPSESEGQNPNVSY